MIIPTYIICNYYRNVIVILLGCVLNSSNTLILIKFGRVYEHFLKNRESSIAHDPLEYYDLQKRIQLCDDVLNARQFMTLYPTAHVKRGAGERAIKLTEWDVAPDELTSVLNYQRSYSTQHDGRDSPMLWYSPRSLRIHGQSKGITIRRILCVRTEEVEWFVTYGLVDEFMYLLEQVRKPSIQTRMRLVGILEPRPVLDNQKLENFLSQHEKYRDEMESICLLKIHDHLRLCSAVLDTLDHLGSLTRTVGRLIQIGHKDQACILKDIRMGGETSLQYFSRCEFVFEDGSESSSLFYTLADSSERGAVFVFLEREGGALELHARLVKIGALVNPTGKTEVQLIADEQNRNGAGEMIRNSDFVSWRELLKLKKKEEQLRRYNMSARSSKARSKTRVKSQRTRQIITSTNEKECEVRTITKKRSQRRKKGKWLEELGDEHVTESDDESDDDVLQRSAGNTSRTKRNMEYDVKNRALIQTRVSKTPKRKYEKKEYQRDGLEMMSDSSKEDYEQSSGVRTRVFEERSERNDQKLLELEMVARTLAEHIGEDFTNKSETPPTLLTNPQSWGRRAKRSQCTYD